MGAALASNDNAEEWALLARTQAAQGRFAEALPAFKKAMSLRPGDASLMADCAEVMANANGQKLDGEPAALVAQALALDPKNLKALALSATAANAKRDFQVAADLWTRALSSVPTNQPELAKHLQARLDEARHSAGLPAAPTSAALVERMPSSDRPAQVATSPAEVSAPPASAVSASTAESAATPPAKAIAGVAGTLSIADDARAGLAPTDAVVITAVAEGAELLLVSVRKQVKDMPWHFTLTDDMARPGGPKLTSAKRVVLQAWVARSGQPKPQAGDWLSPPVPVAMGTTGVRLDVSDAMR
ncbi:MAG: tetratricopeptide repeat protein [Burkholderiales bacterium]|nr:tetratricopeptide repeat protein [Burkholderiales bacterium]